MSSLQTHTDLAFILANHWKQPQESLTDLIDLFKSVPAKRFHSISEVGFETTLSFVFAPVIERMFIGQALTGHRNTRSVLLLIFILFRAENGIYFDNVCVDNDVLGSNN